MAHQWKENPNERGYKKNQGYERQLILSMAKDGEESERMQMRNFVETRNLSGRLRQYTLRDPF